MSQGLVNEGVVAVRKNSGATIGVRRQLNFIEGADITLTVADDSSTPEIDITIAAAVISTFLGLSDTPGSYAGEGGKILAVNATPDAVEFVDTLDNTIQDNITRLGTIVSGVWTGTDIAFANIAAASAASKLLGRGSASGAGDFEEITLGANLSMSATTLSATGGGAPTEETTTATGTQDDFDADAAFTYLRCNNASALILTGFTTAGGAPSEGDRIIIDNIGSSTVKVTNEDAGSTAANRIITSSTNGQIIGADGRMLLVYDDTSSRWRATVIAPGTPIDVAYASGNFTGSGSMTWTVAEADQDSFTYVQYGNMILIIASFADTTVGGTPDTQLMTAMPGGFTIAADAQAVFPGRNAGTRMFGAVVTSTGTNDKFRFYIESFGNWSAATNTTFVTCNMWMRVD